MNLKFRILSKKDNTIRSCNTKEDFELMYDVLYNDNEDYAILQSTGLIDINNKEIFEGDIIKYAGDYEDNSYFVIFDSENLRFIAKNLNLTDTIKLYKPYDKITYKVIGNIFQDK